MSDARQELGDIKPVTRDHDCICGSPSARAFDHALSCPSSRPWNERSALKYATQLAEALWRKHYQHESPEWKPCADLMGVLTQIDNMTAGLTRVVFHVDPGAPEGDKSAVAPGNNPGDVYISGVTIKAVAADYTDGVPASEPATNPPTQGEAQ